MRQKNANNSPYKTGNTDTRNFPNQNGVEVLDQQAFMAIADDVAAIVERVVVVEESGGGGGGPAPTSGAFVIPNGEILTNGTKSGSPNGRVEWYRIGNLVHARIKILCQIASGIYVRVETPWLFAQGLPEPAAITLSPATDFPSAVPVNAQIRSSSDGWFAPRMAIFDPDDQQFLEFQRETGGEFSEIHAEMSYVATP